MNSFIEDEICSASKILGKRRPAYDGQFISTAVVVPNGCILGDYICSLLQTVSGDDLQVLHAGDVHPDAGNVYRSKPVLPEKDGQECITEASICYFIIDCLDRRYTTESAADELAEKLEQWCRTVSQKNGKMVLCTRVPEPEECPEGITSYAEREYNAYLNRKEKLTGPEALYLRVSDIVRKQVRGNALRCTELRFDNIAVPGCDEMVQGTDLGSILRGVADGKITVNEDDQNHIITLLCVGDFLAAVMKATIDEKVKEGHTYNVAGRTCSVMDIKMGFWRAFSEEVTLSVSDVRPADRKYHVLNNLKLRSTRWAVSETLEEICYRLGSYYLDRPYDMNRMLTIFKGRLPRIVEEEKRILKTVDEICRKEGIQFFLAGGSALGAIRHHDIIPWDDDIDIGMLRSDYEKFRKIVPRMLPDDMTYEAANGEGGSHYHFDKIRIKDTYFSTKYSSNFRIEDGIFLDVLVYDQTSNHRFFQRVHIKLTSMWTRIMNVKWKDIPMKKRHRVLSTVVLPVMRLFSWNWFHRRFENIIRHYEKKKGAQYVIDSVGQNIKKGAMKKEWMEEVQLVPFGDTMMPVPAGYDGYLTHLYSSHYMEYLPIRSRVSGHYISRLDLGDKLFSDGTITGHTDLRGELFE